MKLTECFERIGCGERDEKARRVSNVSTKAANITAEEIESGVTIERLSEIGVPVFRYSGQVTIHGSIPDFDPESRPLGYKAIFRNGNGTLGVRYVAVDATKKHTLREAADFGSKGFYVSINSGGCEIIGTYAEKDKAIAGLEKLRSVSTLFYGNLSAGATMFGYAVIAYVGGIPAENVWPLIKAVWGVESESHLETLRAEYKKQLEANNAAWEKEREEQEAKEAAENKIAVERITAKLLADGLQQVFHLPDNGFVAVGASRFDGVKVYEYKIEKGSFGRKFYSRKAYGEAEFSHKRKVAEQGHFQRWEQAASDGRIFV
jgi:hypothetical protein